MGRWSLMYLQLCSEATAENNRGGKDNERIWKEKRRDEGAAYWGEGVHCEWLMRWGFGVNLPSNKNGLIHPFFSPGHKSHAHRAEWLSGTFSSMRSKTQSRNFCHAGITPSPAFIVLVIFVPVVYLCLIPVPLMMGLFIYLQIHTLHGAISPVDHPLLPVSSPLQTLPHSRCILITLFSPLPHPAVSCLFSPFN